MIDEKITEMRKSNARITTILNTIITYEPYIMLDELIALAHIVHVLDEEGIAVSRKEVRTALNKYYKKSEHGEKVSYLNWLYRTGHIKQGTKVHTYNTRKNRDETSGKRAVTVISEPKTPSNSCENALIPTPKGITHEITKNEVFL